METIAIEFGDWFERVWWDDDVLLGDGTKEMNRDATFSGHAYIPVTSVTIGDYIERAWFDDLPPDLVPDLESEFRYFDVV